MRAFIRPSADPTHDIDVTTCLVAALAAELWRRYGGNDVVNWLEAERHTAQLLTPRTSSALTAEARAAMLAFSPTRPAAAQAAPTRGREKRKPAAARALQPV
jgi:hypothetical protein